MYVAVRLRLTRIIPAILLIAVAAVCRAITARRMQGMDIGPGTDLGGLGWLAVVWATMMAAMMLPSLVPMALTCAAARRNAGASSPATATSVFACGYLLTWVGAGVLAYAWIQGVRWLDRSWLAWDQGGPYIAGGVILGPGSTSSHQPNRRASATAEIPSCSPAAGGPA